MEILVSFVDMWEAPFWFSKPMILQNPTLRTVLHHVMVKLMLSYLIIILFTPQFSIGGLLCNAFLDRKWAPNQPIFVETHMEKFVSSWCHCFGVWFQSFILVLLITWSINRCQRIVPLTSTMFTVLIFAYFSWSTLTGFFSPASLYLEFLCEHCQCFPFKCFSNKALST